MRALEFRLKQAIQPLTDAWQNYQLRGDIQLC